MLVSRRLPFAVTTTKIGDTGERRRSVCRLVIAFISRMIYATARTMSTVIINRSSSSSSCGCCRSLVMVDCAAH